MPFLRASVGTLRVVMVIAGFLGSATFVAGLLAETPPVWMLLLNLPALVLSLTLLYFGMTLGAQLRLRPSTVVYLCVAAMVIHGAYALSEIAWNLAHGHFPIPRSAISFLIAWYLYTQSKHLVRERPGTVATAS